MPKETTHSAEEDEFLQEEANNEVADDIESIKRRMAELTEEHSKIKAMQSEIEKGLSTVGEDQEERDARSVFVGNVDYSTLPEELEANFKQAGEIEKILIKSDAYNNPKGFAYIEFKDKSSVENALQLNGTEFKGRILKVLPKRTNLPGLKSSPPTRGRGAPPRGGGRGRGTAPRGGGSRGGSSYRGGPPRGGGRGGGRGRGRGRGGGPY